LQRSPGEALKYPEEDKTLNIPGKAAEKRAERKETDRKEKISLSPEKSTEPASHGDNDCVGRKVHSDGPRGLINAGREAPAYMVERYVDDRRIDDDHECGKHDGEANDPFVRLR